MKHSNQARLSELIKHPREALDIEIKQWIDPKQRIDQAILAKSIIALGNYGGGYLIIGFKQDSDGQFYPHDDRPPDLKAFSQDDIQGIVRRYIEPAVQCSVEHIEHPGGLGVFPIISVPGGNRVPLRAIRGSPDATTLVNGKIYVRCPGPESSEPRSMKDWDDLLERCLQARKDDLLDAFRSIMGSGDTQVPELKPAQELKAFVKHAQARWDVLVKDLPPKSNARFPNGFYEVGALIDGDFEEQSPAEFRETLRQSLRSHSGWPPFVIIDRDPFRPRLVDNSIETWIGLDSDGSENIPAHHDFWRISPNGRFFTRRGYSEDGRYRDMEPGKSFDITTPTWRLGEALIQIKYVADALNIDKAKVITWHRWSGIGGRELVSVGNSRRFIRGGRISHQDEYQSEIEFPINSLSDSLPEIVHTMLSPVYELFDFWEIPKELVEVELEKLLGNTF